MGSTECNRLVVSLMRKALVTQAQAVQARQLISLGLVMEIGWPLSAWSMVIGAGSYGQLAGSAWVRGGGRPVLAGHD